MDRIAEMTDDQLQACWNALCDVGVDNHSDYWGMSGPEWFKAVKAELDRRNAVKDKP